MNFANEFLAGRDTKTFSFQNGSGNAPDITSAPIPISYFSSPIFVRETDEMERDKIGRDTANIK